MTASCIAKSTTLCVNAPNIPEGSAPELSARGGPEVLPQGAEVLDRLLLPGLLLGGLREGAAEIAEIRVDDAASGRTDRLDPGLAGDVLDPRALAGIAGPRVPFPLQDVRAVRVAPPLVRHDGGAVAERKGIRPDHVEASPGGRGLEHLRFLQRRAEDLRVAAEVRHDREDALRRGGDLRDSPEPGRPSRRPGDLDLDGVGVGSEPAAEGEVRGNCRGEERGQEAGQDHRELTLAIRSPGSRARPERSFRPGSTKRAGTAARAGSRASGAPPAAGERLERLECIGFRRSLCPQEETMSHQRTRPEWTLRNLQTLQASPQLPCRSDH